MSLKKVSESKLYIVNFGWVFKIKYWGSSFKFFIIFLYLREKGCTSYFCKESFLFFICGSQREAVNLGETPSVTDILAKKDYKTCTRDLILLSFMVFDIKDEVSGGGREKVDMEVEIAIVIGDMDKDTDTDREYKYKYG